MIISPDGALNFLSFATLLTPDDQFLSQKYSIRYVTSGRDLLRETGSRDAGPMSIFADPDFSGGSGTGTSEGMTRSAVAESLTGQRLDSPHPNPLPKERESIAADPVFPHDSGPYPPLPSVLPLRGGEGRGKGKEDIKKTIAPNSPQTPPSTSSATSSGQIGRLREMERRDFRGLSLPPLPGTAQESQALAVRAKEWNWPTEVHVGAEATEVNLHTIRSPRILHLATHGFFLADEEPKPSPNDEAFRGVGGWRPQSLSTATEPPVGQGPFASLGPPSGPRFEKNPMHRSGLALAGAQATLEAWNRGETPPPANDGIVTAADVGTLDLQGTWLVTLSACDTGMGEVRSGEGVLGLRRAFIQAGAENLLMTLWSVADEETAQIMAEFYERFHANGDAPSALAEVQRDWLVRLRTERGLHEAVLLAGPFILSSQGSMK